MFDTLLAVAVAYFRVHPDDLAHVERALSVDEAHALALRGADWHRATPPWNAPEMQQRLWQEGLGLLLASAAEVDAFFTAKRAALVQLKYREHE